MAELDKLQYLAAGALIATGLSSFSVTVSSEEDIFALKPTMQRCYWLTREIPAEGLCGEKMRPNTETLIREAKKGNSIAAMRLGQLYASGNWGVKLDQEEAIKWFTYAAKLGDRYSQIRLAHAYEFGRMGMTKDISMAIRFYTMATENGLYPDLEEKIEKLERRLAAAK